MTNVLNFGNFKSRKSKEVPASSDGYFFYVLGVKIDCGGALIRTLESRFIEKREEIQSQVSAYYDGNVNIINVSRNFVINTFKKSLGITEEEENDPEYLDGLKTFNEGYDDQVKIMQSIKTSLNSLMLRIQTSGDLVKAFETADKTSAQGLSVLLAFTMGTFTNEELQEMERNRYFGYDITSEEFYEHLDNTRLDFVQDLKDMENSKSSIEIKYENGSND